MDFSQVDDHTLRRYRRIHKLRSTKTTLHRDELVAAVTRHFNEQSVNEKDAVSHFIYALRNQGVLWKANLATRIVSEEKEKGPTGGAVNGGGDPMKEDE